jgi:hypothetical protein
MWPHQSLFRHETRSINRLTRRKAQRKEENKMVMIKDEGKTIVVSILGPEDDYSTGLKIKAGIFPEKVIVKQRQKDGDIKHVEYFKKD